MTTFYQANDVPILLDEFGVDLTLGETTVKALLDLVDEEILDSGAPSPIVGKGVSFTIETGSLPGLVEGSTLTSEGTTYKARQIMQYGDGALTRVLCEVE